MVTCVHVCVAYFIGNAEVFGGVSGGEDTKTHDVGYGSIQESPLGGRQNGNKDMGPGEWKY